MILSLALIFLTGLGAAALTAKLGLPRIIGMLCTGVLLGPCALGLLDASVLAVSADLRRIALIIILIKAGLSLDLGDLKRVGRPALLLSFLPACCEILGYVLLAPKLLGITRTEAALMGAVLAAVSPAVVVPRMVRLIEEGRGTGKGIPQMILAGASLDDVFVIVLFTTLLGVAGGGTADLRALAGVPVSVVLGLTLGAAAGLLLSALFETAHKKGKTVRNSEKTVLVLGVAFLLSAAESLLKPFVPVSGLLAVVGMACMLRRRCAPAVSARLGAKFGKLWLGAEVLLFVLVGAAVDLRYTLAAGLPALALILCALLFRSAGVALSLLGTPLSRRERLFCVIAYLPKATVQAAIGSVPLAAGLPCGEIVLSVAVLGILLTAPLGAIGIDRTCNRFLDCAS
ncbi:MAG: cation:proton antiporter [Clostridia bacterium]|nr:cation:proton antiporter [Clostridia bacterium]